MNLTQADRALAAGIAQAYPLERNAHIAQPVRDILNSISPHVPASGPREYRVTADWDGGRGGFGVTRSFDSEEEALTWGQWKARNHRDAVVTVEPRDFLRAVDAAMLADKSEPAQARRDLEGLRAQQQRECVMRRMPE